MPMAFEAFQTVGLQNQHLWNLQCINTEKDYTAQGAGEFSFLKTFENTGLGISKFSACRTKGTSGQAMKNAGNGFCIFKKKKKNPYVCS